MSYCRVINGSLYVYMATEGLVCCGCWSTPSRTAMAAHIREHAETDPEVQVWVAAQLEAEIPIVGDDATSACVINQP